jgi:hypothetical protein
MTKKAAAPGAAAAVAVGAVAGRQKQPPPKTTTKNDDDDTTVVGRKRIPIPARLPMPIGIEIHNCCCVPPAGLAVATGGEPVARAVSGVTVTNHQKTVASTSTPTTTTTTTRHTPEPSQNQKTKSFWYPKRRTEYSMRLIPHEIRLELCLVPSSSSLHEGEDQHPSSSLSANNNNNYNIIDNNDDNHDDDNDQTTSPALTVVLGRATDTRRSTRVIFSHLDDLVARDDLDIYSYEQLTARFFFSNSTSMDHDHHNNNNDHQPSNNSVAATHRRPPPQYIPFAHANLHPSRLCRIPNIDHHHNTGVACHLPKNAILVHFSDQSIRVAPALYQYLRSINESYVTVREEKIFADTAFYSLDQVQSSSSTSALARDKQHHDTESKERDDDGYTTSTRTIISDSNNNNNNHQ